MEWFHTLSIIATVLGSAYYIHRDIISDMKSQSARTEKRNKMFMELIKEYRE